MSAVNTIIAITDLAFLSLDIYDRLKDDPVHKENFDKLRQYYEQVKNGVSDEQLASIKADVDAMTQAVIEARRKAVDDFVNN